MSGIVINAELCRQKPVVSRTIAVPELITLRSLHKVLMTVFGWKKESSYYFESEDKERYESLEEDDPDDIDFSDVGFFAAEDFLDEKLLYHVETEDGTFEVKLRLKEADDYEEDTACLRSYKGGTLRLKEMNAELAELQLEFTDLPDDDDEDIDDDDDGMFDELEYGGFVLDDLISDIQDGEDAEGFLSCMLWISRLYHMEMPVYVPRGKKYLVKEDGLSLIPVYVLMRDVPEDMLDKVDVISLHEAADDAMDKGYGMVFGYRGGPELWVSPDQLKELPRAAKYTDMMFDSLDAPLEEVFATPEGQKAKALVDEEIKTGDIEEVDEIMNLMEESGISQEDQMAVLYRAAFISLTSIGKREELFKDTFAAALKDKIEEMKTPDEWRSLVIDSRAEQDELKPVMDQILESDDEDDAFDLFQRKYGKIAGKLDYIQEGLKDGSVHPAEVTRGKYSAVIDFMHEAVQMLEEYDEIFEITVLSEKMYRIEKLAGDELSAYRWHVLWILSLEECGRTEEADEELVLWQTEEDDSCKVDAVIIDLLGARGEYRKAEKIAAKYLRDDADMSDPYMFHMLHTMEDLYEDSGNKTALKNVKKIIKKAEVR